MKSPGSVIAGPLFALLGLVAALAQLAFALPGLGLPERWMTQSLVLTGLWVILSLLPLAQRSGAFARLVYTLARFFIYVILVYPLSGAAGTSLAFLCALVAESVMVLSPPADLILPLVFVAYSLLKPEGATAWDMKIHSPGAGDAVLIAFAAVFVGLCLRLYRRTLAKSDEQARLIERLKRSGLDLIDTNLVLQEKVMHQEARIIEMERSRISRELHDIIGYTLMNILAMQKAAAAIFEKDPGRALEFIFKTVAQSERGLRDTREAVGALRGKARRESTIAEAVTMLARAFENTHIRISAHLNNSAPSYGPGIDEALVHFVQEAITNAIKHGNADEISINFWRSAEGVTVSVRDNGSGIPAKGPVSGGLGLIGMNERFAKVRGSIAAGNAAGGFRISAFVPALACEEGY